MNTNSPLNTIGRLDPITGQHTQWLLNFDLDGRIGRLATDSADNVYLAYSTLDQIIKLNPNANTLTSWQLSSGSLPIYLVTDSSDNVYFTGVEGRKIGRLEIGRAHV